MRGILVIPSSHSISVFQQHQYRVVSIEQIRWLLGIPEKTAQGILIEDIFLKQILKHMGHFFIIIKNFTIKIYYFDVSISKKIK